MTPRSHCFKKRPQSPPMPIALVACERAVSRDGEYTVLLVHQHETQSGGVTPCKFARHPSEVQACEIASGHLSEIGSRDARPRRHGLCSDARRTTRVCAAHRRSRGPGDFLIGKGEALRSLPGVRLPAPAPERLCGSFTIHNSQFTIHMANPSYEHGRHTRTGSRCPREGSGQRRSGSVRNSPRASPATRSPAGAQKAQTTWPQPRQLWVAPTREASDVPVGRRGRRGEHIHACRGGGLCAIRQRGIRRTKGADPDDVAPADVTRLPLTGGRTRRCEAHGRRRRGHMAAGSPHRPECHRVAVHVVIRDRPLAHDDASQCGQPRVARDGARAALAPMEKNDSTGHHKRRPLNCRLCKQLQL